ncbi:MAG: HlyD family secretion protein [bacterium]
MKAGRILAATLFLCLCGACGKSDSTSVEPRGQNIEIALVETGELHAVNSKVVTVPRFKWQFSSNGRAKLIWLEEEGKLIKKGDIVARLDTSGVKRVKGQKESDLAIARADLEKMKVEHTSKMRELEADLQSAKAAFQSAEIGLKRVEYESEAAQEINRLRLEVAEIEIHKIQNKIKHKTNIQKEELLIQQEKIKQILSAIENADRTIERFALRAPADGMVEYRRDRRSRSKVRVGQEFWQGRPLVGLPDLSQMKVQTTVNETDVGKIFLGQPVQVRLDAYPKVAFEGKINSISITCHEKEEKSKIKVFDVEVLLKGADPLLKPGMTVSCEILAGNT